mmetsp:Transcript_3517/g.9912  ORF Transcript_3517/g.9912 Transcript_3517/m.9912 type:complete len:228 (-) Transcript_3517:294-977(-)
MESHNWHRNGDEGEREKQCAGRGGWEGEWRRGRTIAGALTAQACGSLARVYGTVQRRRQLLDGRAPVMPERTATAVSIAPPRVREPPPLADAAGGTLPVPPPVEAVRVQPLVDLVIVFLQEDCRIARQDKELACIKQPAQRRWTSNHRPLVLAINDGAEPVHPIVTFKIRRRNCFVAPEELLKAQLLLAYCFGSFGLAPDLRDAAIKSDSLVKYINRCPIGVQRVVC